MPVKLTAQEFATKQAQRLKAALSDMQAGVNRVTVAPGVSAAKRKDKWQAVMSNPNTSAKWAQQVAKVSLADWQRAMNEKGIQRVAAGIDGAQQKVIDFATQLIDYQNKQLALIEKMPSLTLQDSINRMTAWVQAMANFKRQ